MERFEEPVATSKRSCLFLQPVTLGAAGPAKLRLPPWRAPGAPRGFAARPVACSWLPGLFAVTVTQKTNYCVKVSKGGKKQLYALWFPYSYFNF